MKATLQLEYIGESQDAKLALFSGIIDQLGQGLGRAVVGASKPRKPWVAEITGQDKKFGLSREFLKANWQRKNANGCHSRGVELWFVIESGRLYEVKHNVSWKRSERYFCSVDQLGNIVLVSDADAWLKINLK